jgi:hypothetical protein
MFEIDSRPLSGGAGVVRLLAERPTGPWSVEVELADGRRAAIRGLVDRRATVDAYMHPYSSGLFPLPAGWER